MGEVVELLNKWNKEVKTREEQIKSITVEDTSQLKKDRKKLKEEIDELVAGKTTKQELQELHKVLDSIYQCISSKITKDLQHASAAEPEKQALYMRLSDVRDYITQTKAGIRKQLDGMSDK